MTDVRRRRILGLAAGSTAVALAGCGDASRLPSIPEVVRERQPVRGLPDDSRVVLDGHDDQRLAVIARDALKRELAFVAAGGRADLGPATFLAISGGGENGAFGAGLLTAWSQTGTRPEFKGVTGVSTGALMAPAAFLGSAYDGELASFYTNTGLADVMTSRGLLTGLLSDSLYDSGPLLRTIRAFMTPKVLAAIAHEYTVKGRLLLVATTNLDQPVGVLWNMGAIAASPQPQAAELFCRILLASASIPGLLPPVMIDVEVGDQRFQEMHVDGGTVAQVAFYPPSLGGEETAQATAGGDPTLIRRVARRPRRLFIIRNSRPGPDLATIDRSTLKIMQRAMATLISTQGIGDLYQLYLLSLRDGLDYNVAWIPQSFTTRLDSPFEQSYMRKLYDVGRQTMLSGQAWHKFPPGYSPSPLQPPDQL